MREECRSRVYSEAYLDYLVEYYPAEIEGEASQITEESCYQIASGRFAVLYEEGSAYQLNAYSGVKRIPRYYGLLSSAEVLESAGISEVRRQSGLNLYGQGVLVGFIDTGERVSVLSD